MPKKKSLPIKNRILAAVPRNEYEQLLPDLEFISLLLGVSLYNSGDAIEHVYFQYVGGAPRRRGNRSNRAANGRIDSLLKRPHQCLEER